MYDGHVDRKHKIYLEGQVLDIKLSYLQTTICKTANGFFSIFFNDNN